MIGIVLAGGRATRLGGGDKGLRTIGGRPILDHVVAAMSAQCHPLIINANGDPARFARFGLPIVPDDLADHPGPLAGLLAGLDWVARHQPDALFAVTAPTDTPFLPTDLVARLESARLAPTGPAADIVCACSGGSTHYVAALWTVALRHDLRDALASGSRRMSRFLDRHLVAYADWSTVPHDPFFNINKDEDLRLARVLVEPCKAETPDIDVPREDR